MGSADFTPNRRPPAQRDAQENGADKNLKLGLWPPQAFGANRVADQASQKPLVENGPNDVTAQSADDPFGILADRGGSPTVAYVRSYLQLKKIFIHADGALRLARVASQLDFRPDPTLDTLRQDIVKNAADLGLPFSPIDLKRALHEVLEDAKEKRWNAILEPLFVKLSEAERAAAVSQWRSIGTLFDTPIAVPALMHFVWQLKRKVYRLPVDHHLMPVITNPVQGSGKTTFVSKLVSVLNELCASGVLLSDLADPRSSGIFGYPAVVVDDMESLNRKSGQALKSVLTASDITRRVLGTSKFVSSPQSMTPIGTANTVVEKLINDDTGHRRFVVLNFRNGNTAKGGAADVWPTVNALDAALLWRSVDEQAASPIIEHLEALYEWQDASRPRCEVEEWLATLDPMSPGMRAIRTDKSVQAQKLFELFKRETLSDLNDTRWGMAMNRLMTKVGPFAGKSRVSGYAIYVLKTTT